MQVLIGTKNPGKIQGAKEALENNFLTQEEITRIDLTRQAFIMALTQFINGGIWRDI